MAGLQAALPREHYVDPDTWRTERERVLLREWTCLGRLDELGLSAPGSGTLRPGRRAVVDLHGESVVVTTGPDARLHAFANVCRHRGSQLVPVDPAGELPAPCDAKALRCPYHSWTYDLAGDLLHAPHTDGVGIDPKAFSLHALAADSWGGWLWLNGDRDAAPLQDALGAVPERVRRYPLATLVVGLRFQYEVRANWKVVAENYNECYHCGPVHPELSRRVPSFAGGGAELAWEGGIPHRMMRRALDPPAAREPAPLPPHAQARLLAAQDSAQARAAIAELLAEARHEVMIYTRDLDPALLDVAAALDELRRVALSGRHARIRVIIHDARAPLVAGHRLLALAQRLSSTFELRTPTDERDQQYPSAFVLNDRHGYFFRPLGSRPDGDGATHAPGRHGQLRALFDQVWERSAPSDELRRLAF